ncbi:MAG: glycosyltransferase [Planctomycetota bacterium]
MAATPLTDVDALVAAAGRTDADAATARPGTRRASRPRPRPDAATRRTTDTQSDGQSGPTGKLGEPLLLEVSWEVCNQLGGIYTVLRSKAPAMVERWGNRYCLIGPYKGESANIEFEPSPMVGPIGAAARALNDMGYNCHYGRWLVSGRPHVLLLETGPAWRYLGEVKYRLWTDHAIPTPAHDHLINDVIAFGECCRLALTLLGERESARRQIVAHFHEWMAGVCIPMLRKENWPGGTVFTTHATLLGRYLAMNHPVFYDHLPFFDADAEARHYNIDTQHRFESAAAHGAHVFSTVSDVTGDECTHLLGRKPDAILPNGLNITRFAAGHEFQVLHNQFKQRIHEFTVGHFFPSYPMDLDKTLYFFTSGRYEFRNKGMDLTIEALARLNHRLREAGTDVNVVFFIITRAPCRSINVTALQQSAMLSEFRTCADAITDQIADTLFISAAAGEIPDLNAQIDEYWRLRLRRNMQQWKRDLPPPIITHDLRDDAADPVLAELRRCRLFNHQDDPVKVVFHPDFITSSNPLFQLEYDQFVRGCHLGVFPSYYEPWGYTPLESIALGVPAITSDLAGFGAYLKALLPDHEEKGTYLIHRRNKDFHAAADELADQMLRFCQLDQRGRINLRNRVESFSEHFDWSNLGRKYNDAHDLAMERARTAEAGEG